MLGVNRTAIPYNISSGLLSQPRDQDIFHDENGTIRRYRITADPSELVVKGAVLTSVKSLGPIRDPRSKGHTQFVTESARYVANSAIGAIDESKLPDDETALNEFIHNHLQSQLDSLLRCLTTNRRADGSSFDKRITFSDDGHNPDVVESIQTSAYGRRVCQLATEHLVLVPEHTQVDDAVALVLGCPLPLVLRVCTGLDEIKYTIVGVACMHRLSL
jgi:hypothetical protein